MPKLYYKSGSSWVNALNIFYPVGAFYISNVSTSPATLLGGTWAQVTDAAIRGATGAGYTGSDTTTLTVNQIPAHTHYFRLKAFGHQGNTTTSGEPKYWNDGNNDGTVWVGGLGNTSNAAITGGGRTPTFSALTTVSFGIALPKRGWC